MEGTRSLHARFIRTHALHPTIKEDMPDQVEALADKVIEAFEPFSGTLLLEQIAVPEDLEDPRGAIDLWMVATEAQPVGESSAEAIVVRGSASIPTGAVRELGTGELTDLLRQDILESQDFREARLTARIASAGTQITDVPSADDVRRN